MSNARNRVTAIGLEVEGGWSTQPPNMHHDGSVRGLSGVEAVGEVSSDPIPTLDQAEAWLRRYYPQQVNDSCGFHVHVSLPPLHYSRLMDENFNLKFLSEMEEFWNRYRSQRGFDQFRTRLDGQNRYCQKVFRPEEQLWRTEPYGDVARLPRYSQLNYCFGRHGTLECRLFPCFPEVEHSVEGMRIFVNCINAFLASCKPAKPINFTLIKEEVEKPVNSGPHRLSVV